MADIDEVLDEVKDDEVVEDQGPDEAEELDTNEDETNDEATDESDDSEGEEDSEEQTFERRYKQFKGETLEEYVKNLEEGYSNSSAEAVRMNRELKRLREEKLSTIANTDTDDKEEPKKQEDPALIYARQKMEEDAQKDYKSFSKLHPEIDETSDQFDESLFEEFDKEAGYARDYLYRTTGKIPTLMDAMKRAWAVMDLETESNEEKLAMSAKSAGSGTKAKGTAKEQPKPKFSDAQIENVKKMDPKLEGKSRAEIEEILSKYIK